MMQEHLQHLCDCRTRCPLCSDFGHLTS